MRVADLNPKLDGMRDGLLSISMDCPKCGAPYRVAFSARMGGERKRHEWTCSVTFSPMIQWDTLSVLPSVHFDKGTAHGRKRQCFAHFSVSSGKVTIA